MSSSSEYSDDNSETEEISNKRGMKMKYDEDNDFEEGQWIGDEYYYKKKKKAKVNTKDEQLYGVFDNNSSDDDSRKRHFNNNKKGKSRSDSKNVAFVSSKTAELNEKSIPIIPLPNNKEIHLKEEKNGVDDTTNEFRKIIEDVNTKTKTNSEFSKLIKESETIANNETSTTKKLSVPPPPPPSVVKNLGQWEKHTKGIGKKILEKFGFQGRLGARENGITSAVEVVVRPEGLGLGFGDFKEAAVLESNKKIEAEWHGKEYKEETNDRKSGKGSKNTSKSEARAESKSWKLGGATISEKDLLPKPEPKESKKKKKSVRIADVVDDAVSLLGSSRAGLGSGTTIIDMRGSAPVYITDGSISTESTVFTSTPLFCEELLHNIQTLTEKEEMELHQMVSRVKHVRQSLERSENEIKALEVKLVEDENRLEGYTQIYSAINKIQEVLSLYCRNELSEMNISAGSEIRIMDVIRGIQKVYNHFPIELSMLGLIPCVPQLGYELLHHKISNWDIAEDPLLLADIYLEWSNAIESLELPNMAIENGPDKLNATQAVSHSSDISNAKSNLSNLIETLALPKLRRYIINEFRVTSDTHKCVTLMRSIKGVFSDENFNTLVDMTLMPKITNEVQAWNPTSDRTPIHVWIMPWIDILNNTTISTVFPEIRRKLASALVHWNALDYSAYEVISPWTTVFDATSMENFLTKFIIPKLVVAMRAQSVEPGGQSLEYIQAVLKWRSIISRIHMLALLEGEFFPRWFKVLQYWLLHSPDFSEVSKWYMDWKSVFPDDLSNDESIVYYFNFALDMMSTALNFDQSDEADNQSFLSEVDTNPNKILPVPSVFNVSANYFKIYEKKQNEVNSIRRLNELQSNKNQFGTNISSSRSSAITFREVIEEFALRNNLEFSLKVNQLHEGKQLYQFQHILLDKNIKSFVTCYIDQNVVFVKRKTEKHIDVWKPTSLEEIVSLCT